MVGKTCGNFMILAGNSSILDLTTLIRKAIDLEGIDGGVVNNVTADWVRLEKCRLNMSYICLLTLTYPKIELSE